MSINIKIKHTFIPLMRSKLSITNFNISLFLICMCLSSAVAQVEIPENYIEEVIENLQGEEDFDYNTLFETLEYYSTNPLYLNEATAEDLADLFFLDDVQINAILSYRQEQGDFISLYELQAVPTLSIENVRQLIPFITLNDDENQYQLPLGDMFTGGRHELFLRYNRTVEDVRGQMRDDLGVKRFEGDPNNLYARYRYNYDNRMSLGFTMEKDAGESFFRRSNKSGFDFYSAHFHLKDVVKNVKDLAIGDYTISLGQGLIAHNNFGGTKSAEVLNIKKSGRTIRPYTSKNEANFFRGLAATYAVHPTIDLTVFGSLKNNDGNIIQPDTLEREDVTNIFSSIREDGFHRTQSDIEDENTLTRFSTGGRVQFRKSNITIGANILHERFNEIFQPQDQLYNQFRFSGQSLLNASVDYSFKLKNVNLFGEFARSENGGTALINGALLTLNKNTDLAILYRNYGIDYQNLIANTFGEGSSTQNEKGVYVALSHSINNHWSVRLYVDQWRNPWLRFRVDRPATGREYLFRLNYYKRDKFIAYAQYKYESKIRNESANESVVDNPIPINLHKLRYNQRIIINSFIELRNRLEFSFFEDTDVSRGMLIAQDLLYKKDNFKATARLSYFNTDDFDARIYAFESDLLYNFFVPFFQNEGLRYYINLRYGWNYNLTTELRFARTDFFDVDEIGSGDNLISGNAKTDIKLQLRYRF